MKGVIFNLKFIFCSCGLTTVLSRTVVLHRGAYLKYINHITSEASIF